MTSDTPATNQHDHESTEEMSFLEHLGELRTRLINSFLAIGAGSIIAYLFADQVFGFLAQPYFAQFPDSPLIGTGPAEAFVMKLKVSVFAGILLALPVLFYQIWAFISPGLHDHEKKFAVPFVLFTTLLFLIGSLFCFYVVFPFAFEFFQAQYDSIGITATVKIGEHIAFVTRVLIAFGLVFELPVLAYFLGRLGVITDQWLISGFRYAIVVIFALAAILTPPDIVTQFLMAGPLILLYGLSIFIVRFAQKKSTPE